MNQTNQFINGVRVANFTSIDLPLQNVLELESSDTAGTIRKIKRYADLPYIFAVDDSHAQDALEVISKLKAIRSPCVPYAILKIADAVIDLEDPNFDVVSIQSTNSEEICNQINAYAASRLRFDDQSLHVGNSGSPPESVDVIIVGGGITGIYAANRLKQEGLSYSVLEKSDSLGGIWSMYANATSRVNSSECAYRLVEDKFRSNRDHSSTREILEDISLMANSISERIFLKTEVEKVEKREDRYVAKCVRDGKTYTITCKGVILAINDRVGSPREIEWNGQAGFRGRIVKGISDEATDIDWEGKKVVIVGMGAFAIENARTALEGGASLVTVVCRRHGTVCPKIIDYLNFATPYDAAFKHDKKSNFRNMMYWKKMYDLSGATQPECWMGKVKHEGHTISVSDIWFVAHYLKKIETVTGRISGMYENGVIVDEKRQIEADIVVNCIGFERNTSMAKALSGYDETTNINFVDKNFMYLADAYIDDDAFNSFFGSSVLEMVKFYMEVFIRFFDDPRYEELIGTEGIVRIPIDDRRWSHYIAGAAALIEHHPDLYEVAKDQVDRRTQNFLEKHDLETYIAENKREWIDMHSMLAGKPVAEEDCMPYVFDKLLPK